MKVPHLSSLLFMTLSLLSVSGAVLADDAAMADHAILKCRAMSDVQARLGCYDAIPVGAPTAAAVSAGPSAVQSFGMETVKPKEAAPQSIESTIEGDFMGWEAGSQIKLANGQVWRVTDGSSAVLPGVHNPKVKVVRNLFGTTFMEIEGTNNSPKVRRLR